ACVVVSGGGVACVTDRQPVVGRAAVLSVPLHCVRRDAARRCLAEGRTPALAEVLPAGGWEARETPGTFTLPAHLAFFHGFLPTPFEAGPHRRLFALGVEGALTTRPATYSFAGVPDVIAGFPRPGHPEFCVGRVGLFHQRHPLGR